MTRAQRFRKILVAVGGAKDVTDTVPVVIDLAQAFESEVLVLHLRERMVAAGGTLEQESIPEAFQFCEQVARLLAKVGLPTSVDVHATTPSDVGDDILDAANDFGAQLIVIGPHHSHGVRERMFGDIGRILAHGSRCPVLFLPSGPPGSQREAILC